MGYSHLGTASRHSLMANFYGERMVQSKWQPRGIMFLHCIWYRFFQSILKKLQVKARVIVAWLADTCVAYYTRHASNTNFQLLAQLMLLESHFWGADWINWIALQQPIPLRWNLAEYHNVMERAPWYLEEAHCLDLQRTCVTWLKLGIPRNSYWGDTHAQLKNMHWSRMLHVWPMDAWHVSRWKWRSFGSPCAQNFMCLSACYFAVPSIMTPYMYISLPYLAQGFQELTYFSVTERAFTGI